MVSFGCHSPRRVARVLPNTLLVYSPERNAGITHAILIPTDAAPFTTYMRAIWLHRANLSFRIAWEI